MRADTFLYVAVASLARASLCRRFRNQHEFTSESICVIEREGELPAVTTSSLCRRSGNFPPSDVS